MPAQPIVIVGGFLSFGAVYCNMRAALLRLTGQPVWIVPLRTSDWLRGDGPEMWVRLLNKLDRAARQAAGASPTGKVTLIGHSAGGVISRLYLSPTPFHGRAYCGLERVTHLITLGSPHHNQPAGQIRRWADDAYPGAYFAPQVCYASVAGQAIQGKRRGAWRERLAYRFYERLCGDGQAWGDGLVPVASQLLAGSRQIVLEGVSHFTGFGGPWYGARKVIPRWWNACASGDTPEFGE